MKIRFPILALASALALMPALRAQDEMPKKMAPKEEQTELGGKMEKINRAFRVLNKVDPNTKLAQVADPAKNEDSLKQVAIMLENAEAGAKLQPALTSKKPADEQAKFVDDFHAQMKTLVENIGKLQTALKAGDNATAVSIVADLKKEENDGHTEFRPKRGKKM